MSKQLNVEERIALQRETIRQHIHSENGHDWERVYDTFVRDETAYYDVMPLNTHFKGIQGIEDFYSALEKAVPDFKIVVTSEFDTPGVSIREVTVTGTHQSEYCGTSPKGNAISFEIAAFYIFGEAEQAGKLLAERAYWDNETVLAQMRGDVEAKTGVGLVARSKNPIIY